MQVRAMLLAVGVVAGMASEASGGVPLYYSQELVNNVVTPPEGLKGGKIDTLDYQTAGNQIVASRLKLPDGTVLNGTAGLTQLPGGTATQGKYVAFTPTLDSDAKVTLYFQRGAKLFDFKPAIAKDPAKTFWSNALGKQSDTQITVGNVPTIEKVLPAPGIAGPTASPAIAPAGDAFSATFSNDTDGVPITYSNISLTISSDLADYTITGFEQGSAAGGTTVVALPGPVMVLPGESVVVLFGGLTADGEYMVASADAALSSDPAMTFHVASAVSFVDAEEAPEAGCLGVMGFAGAGLMRRWRRL